MGGKKAMMGVMGHKGSKGGMNPMAAMAPQLMATQAFIMKNGLDSVAAEKLMSANPMVQQLVMSEGDISARNPSAACIARITRTTKALGHVTKKWGQFTPY